MSRRCGSDLDGSPMMCARRAIITSDQEGLGTIESLQELFPRLWVHATTAALLCNGLGKAFPACPRTVKAEIMQVSVTESWLSTDWPEFFN